MLKILNIGLALLGFTFLQAQNPILSPEDYLPTDYGDKFTPHYLHDQYVRYLAEHSSYISHEQYGWTEEKRPLNFLIISDPENLSTMDDIRLDNLRRAGLAEGDIISEEDIAIVWIGCGVHGNEAGSAESALTILSKLANPTIEIQTWLKKVIVLFDPSVNPDGYDRYTQWNREVTGNFSNVNANTYEHQEPWPGGRLNHYQFDLNRDWLWCTQSESRQRIKKYNQWMPHVAVDIHEMNHNSTYYFAPAAEPYHEHLTDWQRKFQMTVGENNAKHFDHQEWGYFTREIFDLLYPSYGDTYPSFNGSIGMTYEQAGHSRAEQAVELSNGDTLKIQDRIDHHTTAVLSTIEMAADHSRELVSQFSDYFKRQPISSYKSYIIKREHNIDLIEVEDFLTLHGIRYFQAIKDSHSSQAYHFTAFQEKTVDIKSGDMVIPINQPKSTLVDVLCNPNPLVVDSLTYDITAWSYLHSLPYTSYALKDHIAYEDYERQEPESTEISNPVSFYLSLHKVESFKTLMSLLNQGYIARYNINETHINNKILPPGTVFFNVFDNHQKPNFKKTLLQKEELIPIKPGINIRGKDLGSNDFYLIEKPNIALLTGDGTNPNANGHIWHFIEKKLEYPVNRLLIKNISKSSLSDMNILIMPHGGYSEMDSSKLSIIFDFAENGGKVIAEDGALPVLIDHHSLGLKLKEENEPEESESKKAPIKFAQATRAQLTSHNPGVVIKVEVDHTHPLSTGLSDHSSILKLNTSAYDLLKDSWNIAFTTDPIAYSGYMGTDLHESLSQSLQVGQENFGEGQFVYFVDRPLFRGFWQNSQITFCNALVKNVR